METNAAISALQSLAQETRLAIFRLLVRAGHTGLTAGEIAEELAVPAPTLSFHLSHLCNAGLLERRREGRSLWYAVRFDSVSALLNFLMEDCCQGRTAHAAPEAVCSPCTDCAPTAAKRSKRNA